MPNCTFWDFGSVFPPFWLHLGLPRAPFWADFHRFSPTFLVIACRSFASYRFHDFWSVLLVLWFCFVLGLFVSWLGCLISCCFCCFCCWCCWCCSCCWCCWCFWCCCWCCCCWCCLSKPSNPSFLPNLQATSTGTAECAERLNDNDELITKLLR